MEPLGDYTAGVNLSTAPLTTAPITSTTTHENPALTTLVPGVKQDYDEADQKLREVIYNPKGWVNEALMKIKLSSSLNGDVLVVPESVKVDGNTLSMDITQGKATAIMKVQFFQDGIIKCHCLNPVNPSRFSFELVEKPANLVPHNISQHTTLESNQAVVNITETKSQVRVGYSPFNVSIISLRNGEAETLFNMNTSNSLKFTQSLSADFTFHTEYLYGLAEHGCNLLLEDTKEDKPYRFFNQDVYGYPLESKNAIYGAIPLIVTRKKESPTFVSLYWQNTSDTYIDIHKKDSCSSTYWLSERGNLECYIFVNHSASSHFKSLSNVFGHSAMPQYFALGYHQCRYSYKDQKDVLKVNSNFNKFEIPCDSITLDIDHTQGKRYFTWNKKLYPDPVGMQEILVNDGRQLVTICDPHIKVDHDYHVYQEAVQNNLYVKNKRGYKFTGQCWPGESIYLDYLNEETRDFWASQYSYEKYKYSTPNLWAWNDMNEPSVFKVPGLAMPADNLQTYMSHSDPENSFQVEHREVHNIYGFCMVKGTYDGVLKRNKSQNIRPHVLSRSFFAGSQKHTAVWTGDTHSTWPYLKATVPMLLSLSLCGLSFCGGDVGGFTGNPEPELAIRWYQLGTFMPYFRAHSSCSSNRREPWLYPPKYMKLIKEAIKERYKLLPYWYTCFEEHCRTAVPVMRPLWFEEEKVLDPEILFEQERFMIGEEILVVPILEKGKNAIKGFLKGLSGRWYDYYTSREVFEDAEIKTGLERVGAFVKGGSIIPLFELKSTTKSSKDARESNMNLYVALDEESKSKGSVYFDDGETFNYKKGEFMRKTLQFDKDTLVWEGNQDGGYKVDNKVTKAVITGLSQKFSMAVLVEEGKPQQKIVLINREEGVVLEFVAEAKNNWKIILS